MCEVHWYPLILRLQWKTMPIANEIHAAGKQIFLCFILKYHIIYFEVHFRNLKHFADSL
jgi:hypothetical protein